MKQVQTLLSIESSCDDTSVALVENGQVLANVVANQEVHKSYGGVVPELASRAHTSHIVPLVAETLRSNGMEMSDLDAIVLHVVQVFLGLFLWVGNSPKGCLLL